MNSRRLISSIGFLRTDLSKLGRSQPLVLGSKDTTPKGRQVDCCTDCCTAESPAPSADGVMAEMGHKRRDRAVTSASACPQYSGKLPQVTVPVQSRASPFRGRPHSRRRAPFVGAGFKPAPTGRASYYVSRKKILRRSRNREQTFIRSRSALPAGTHHEGGSHSRFSPPDAVSMHPCPTARHRVARKNLRHRGRRVIVDPATGLELAPSASANPGRPRISRRASFSCVAKMWTRRSIGLRASAAARARPTPPPRARRRVGRN
jgi:hypothetical protein